MLVPRGLPDFPSSVQIHPDYTKPTISSDHVDRNAAVARRLYDGETLLAGRCGPD